MNRLRHAYLEIARPPSRRTSRPVITTRQGFLTSYQLASPSALRLRAAFVVAAAALLGLQRQNLDPLRGTTPRFPTPPGGLLGSGLSGRRAEH